MTARTGFVFVAAAANTTDSSLEEHSNNAALLTNGAAGAGTIVLETKLETSEDTARFEPDDDGGA
jgi:hypothetical protein